MLELYSVIVNFQKTRKSPICFEIKSVMSVGAAVGTVVRMGRWFVILI